MRRYDDLLAGGYQAKSAGGLLVDILRNPQKYLTLEQEAPTVARGSASGATMPRLVQEVELPEAPRTLTAANFILKKIALSESDKAAAAELFLDGHVSVAELASLALDDDPGGTVFAWRSRRSL